MTLGLLNDTEPAATIIYLALGKKGLSQYKLHLNPLTELQRASVNTAHSELEGIGKDAAEASSKKQTVRFNQDGGHFVQDSIWLCLEH